jgi:hypothetical protein
MASAIDASKPADGVPANKADLRLALATAKNEITALQGQVSGMRNRIINGSFRHDQRNAGAAVSVAAGTTSVFGSDRWYGSSAATGGVFSLQNLSTTPPPGHINYSRVLVTTGKASLAAGDFHLFSQAVEGFHWQDMLYGTPSAVTAVLTFWVRASIAGTYSVALQNTGSAVSYVTTYSIALANTWEFKTIVVPGATIGTWGTFNSTAVCVRFDLGSGTTFSGATINAWVASNKVAAAGSASPIGSTGNTWDIGGVQLEPGLTATSYEYRLFADTLAQVQRYYLRGQFNFAGSGTVGHTYQNHVTVSPALRSTPTIARTAETIANITTPAVTPTPTGFLTTGTFTATAAYAWSATYAADAEIIG